MHTDEYRETVQSAMDRAGSGSRGKKPSPRSSNNTLEKAQSRISRLESQNKDLEQKIAALRHSRTMKASRVVAFPFRKFKTLKRELGKQDSLRELSRQVTKVRKKLRLINSSQDLVSNTQVKSSTPVAAKSDSKKSSDYGSRKPNAEKNHYFEKDLVRAWYGDGSISSAAAIIEELSAEQMELASEKTQRLITRIKGIVAVANSQLEVPPRTDSPAYLVEDDRVMYCVHSTPVFNSNGYSTRTRGVAQGIGQAGEDIVVVARTGYPWDSASEVAKPAQRRCIKELDGIPYVHVPGGNLNRDPLNSYLQLAADAFVREALLNRPAVIQSASNFRTALPALIAARRVGVPFVYEVRGLWEITEATSRPGFENSERFEFMKNLETLVACEADSVLAITNQVAEELISRGVPADKISVAPNAVDTNRFLPYPKDESFAKAKGIDPGQVTIGFAGSVVDYEGLESLIKASALLQAEDIPHLVVIAGSGKSEVKLKALAESLKNTNVKFLGRLPQNDIPRLMSTFDIVVCPRESNQITELVSPLKPLESFSSGIATVLSDVSPNVDLACGEDSERAVLFEAGNVADLAKVLATLISDETTRHVFGQAGRKWVLEQRTWKKICAQMVAVHKRLLNDSRNNRRASALKSISELQVGIIADEFTLTTMANSCRVVPLQRDNFAEQLAKTRLDLIFVESAWLGNGGQWSHGIGYYSEEESEDLFNLLRLATSFNIPTVFWNKEDPVHFDRFAPTAARFDYVFTTDANMIPKYLETPGRKNKAVSALPFYAQPKIHNPLGSPREFHSTFAYAGTYYGDRYPERSKRLDQLLEVASSFGLEIYDRQANNPESPYKFPEKFEKDVRGALPYEEVINTYDTHIAHLNVNSVVNSPTMFSRRVVEVPACGGILVSSPGRGIEESLGSNIATSSSKNELNEWMSSWATDSGRRLQEIWRQMRTIYRSHTADTALSILFRTVGIPVKGLELSSVALEIGKLSSETVDTLMSQSVRPTEIICDDVEEPVRRQADEAGISIVPDSAHSKADYLISISDVPSRTFIEDLLLFPRFGDWNEIHVLPWKSYDGQTAVCRQVVGNEEEKSKVATLVRRVQESNSKIVVFLPPSDEEIRFRDKNANSRARESKRILFAGHDLKFAQGIMRYLTESGYQIIVDEWSSHTQHDETKSLKLNNEADVVFCEWGLGNAVWYSKHKKPGQRLIVRVHSQELRRPFLKQLDADNVDAFIFVGELIKQSAILSHGILAEKSIVIPNAVEVDKLANEKYEGADFCLGMVGIVPRSKRLDLAIDLIEMLLEHDTRYHLRIKGKEPSDFPWMAKRPSEMQFFKNQFDRIDRINKKFPGAIILDGYGNDMAEWYKKIGIAISTSDFESFHLTLADGAASGAMPVSLMWPGADQIYPLEWLHCSVDKMAESILNKTVDKRDAAEFASENFNSEVVYRKLESIIRDN